MKNRPKGFLSPENIDHESELFDYITELHEYLWKFVRCSIPAANGSLSDHLDRAIRIAHLNKRGSMEPFVVFYVKTNPLGYQKTFSKTVMAKTPEDAVIRMNRQWKSNTRRQIIRIEDLDGKTIVNFQY